MTRILLIEDNEDHADLIRRSLLKGFGKIRLHIAVGAKESYRKLEENKFDLILSDYYLPGIEGETHIHEINKRAPHVPIVIITGQGDEKIAAKSIQSGAEDYVVKTREALEALPTILKRALVKHRSHQKNKKEEIRSHLDHQKAHVKKVLGEVEQIDRHMKRLKKMNGSPKKSGTKKSDPSTLEHLTRQIDSLKKFVKSVLFKK